MKKLLALSLILVMLLCSCNVPAKESRKDTNDSTNDTEDVKKPLTYTIYVGGESDNILGNTTSKDGPRFESAYSLGIEEFTNMIGPENPNAEKEKKFTVDGTEYNLPYHSSSSSLYSGKKEGLMKNFGASDRYIIKESVGIEIRPESNTVVYFSNSDVDIKTDGDFTEEDAREKAQTLFKEFYGEEALKEYSIESVSNVDTATRKTIKVFFRRSVYGYGTVDTVSFTMNQKGELWAVLAETIFLFNDVENEVSKTEIEAAEKVLRESISDEWKLSEWAKLTRDSKGKIYLFVNGINEKISDESGDQLFYINVN